MNLPCYFLGALVITVCISVSVGCAALPDLLGYGKGVLDAKPRTSNEMDVNVQGVHILMVRIPSGTFKMGSDSGSSDEQPVHSVTISREFWLGKFPVLEGQYWPIWGKGLPKAVLPWLPATDMTFLDVQEYIGKINSVQDAFLFRLPTEAEWEYACRAGTTGEWYGPPRKIAWYGHPFLGAVRPPGLKEPNAFGLHDMLGNISEWVEDWYGPYSSEAQTDPQGPANGFWRVFRGGAYFLPAKQCRAASRCSAGVGYAHFSVGFRLVAVPRAKGAAPIVHHSPSE